MVYTERDIIIDAIRAASLAGDERRSVTPYVNGLDVVKVDDKWALYAGDMHVKTFRLHNDELVWC